MNSPGFSKSDTNLPRSCPSRRPHAPHSTDHTQRRQRQRNFGGHQEAAARNKKETHTHPFNGPFSGTTEVSRYQKRKTNLDFTEGRDSEWQWNQLGHMQVCNSLQTDNHASTPPLSFLRAGCPSCRPTNSVKALNKKESPHFIGRQRWRYRERRESLRSLRKTSETIVLNENSCENNDSCG